MHDTRQKKGYVKIGSRSNCTLMRIASISHDKTLVFQVSEEMTVLYQDYTSNMCLSYIYLVKQAVSPDH